jgi:hypothetical protein
MKEDDLGRDEVAGNVDLIELVGPRSVGRIGQL